MEELLIKGVIAIPLLLLAVSAHEAAHAWAALRCGDDTAARLGRISLYPPRHIDLLGSLALPLITLALTHGTAAYGYAKPTPVDPARLRSPKRDYSLVAVAGPLSNLLLALALAGASWSSRALGLEMPAVQSILGWGIAINVMLGAFNLLPLPGFDGMKTLYFFLPDAWCWRLNRAQPFFFLTLMLIFWLGLFDWFFEPMIRLIALLCAFSGAIAPFPA